MKKKLLSVVGLLALSGAALAGPTDNSLVLGTTQQPTQLDPYVNNQAISAEVNSWLFAGLTYFDPNRLSSSKLSNQSRLCRDARSLTARGIDRKSVV